MPFDIYKAFNHARMDDRAVDELIGLSHGLLADGKIDKSEVEFLQQWLARNKAVASSPVIAILLQRVNEVLLDGLVDESEAAELFDTLRQLTGGNHEIGEITKSTTLPLNDPEPEILFTGKRFCFTGTFAYGTRAKCEGVISDLGGLAGNLTMKTEFLVVGIYATDSWVHTSYGRKIEKAAQLRQEGLPLAIVGEAHWAKFIPS